MKKKSVGLVICAMGLMMVACASKDKAPQVEAPVIESIPAEETENVDAENEAPEDESTGIDEQENENTEIDDQEEEIYVGMANPWEDSDREGVLKATGFDLVVPEGSVNVAYSYMTIEGMAQLNYTTDAARWIYRVQPTDELQDISGIYCEWDYIGETKVAGMDAMEYSYVSDPEGDLIGGLDCTRIVNWFDSEKKITYSLAAMGTDLNGMDIVVYAEELYNLGGE